MSYSIRRWVSVTPRTADSCEEGLSNAQPEDDRYYVCGLEGPVGIVRTTRCADGARKVHDSQHEQIT